MLNNILSAVNDWMYTYLLLFLLVGTGIYFTIRTRFVQLRLLKESFHVLKEKAGEENGKKQVSSFQALMISTASRVGTGNIAGIATAIAQAEQEQFSGCGLWQSLAEHPLLLKVPWHRFIK